MARSSLFLHVYAFVWAPYICMEKMLIISNDFSSRASRPLLLKFHMEPLGERNERLLKWSWSTDQYGCMTIYGKSLQNSSPEPNKPWVLMFAQIIWNRRSTKIAKMMVLCWWLTFLRTVKFASPCICMGPIHLYWKNVENSYFRHHLYNQVESKMLSIWSLWAEICSVATGWLLDRNKLKLCQSEIQDGRNGSTPLNIMAARAKNRQSSNSILSFACGPISKYLHRSVPPMALYQNC